MTTLIETDVLAGPFTLAYTPSGGSAASLGIIGPEGIRLTKNYACRPITSDLYGRDTILDGVYQGGNLYLEFLLQEANKANVKAMAFPFNVTTTSGSTMSLENELGVPGKLWSTGGGVLVLTAVTGTKAASEGTPTRTYSNIVPAPGHQLDYFLASDLRTFPMRLLALPYDIGSAKIGTHTKA